MADSKKQTEIEATTAPTAGGAAGAFQRDASSQLQQAMAEPLPAARRDVQISPQLYLGKTVYVVKDPVSLTYFRFKPAEHYVYRNLDGQINANDMARKVARHFPDHTTEPEDVLRFIQMLRGSGLLLGRGESHGSWLRNMRDTRSRKTTRAKWFNFLFIKIPVMDPDRMLDSVYSMVRLFMNRWTMWFALLLMAGALAAVAFEAERVANLQFPILGWTNLMLLTVTFFFVKVIHEFGHGLAAKHHGLEVHEIGVMLMVFFPIFYVDVSDAWMVPRRRDRMWITAGGVFIEMLFATLAAFVFLSTEPGIVNQLAFNIMLAASVTTILFNANPLLRYDGYYFLMDWMQIPNLRTKAGKFTGYLAKKYLLGMKDAELPEEAGTHPIFMPLYSVAAGFYRWFIVIGIIALTWHILDPYGLEAIGALMGMVAFVTMLMLPLWKMVAFVWAQQRAAPLRQVLATLAGFGVMVGVVVGVGAIPWEQTVEQPVVILAAERQPVYFPVTGSIEEVHVTNGQQVDAGDPLLTLSNHEIIEEIDDLKVTQKLTRVELEVARQTRKLNEVATHTTSLEYLADKIAHLELKLEQLVIRAPISGRLDAVARPETMLGRRFEVGFEFGTVISDATRQVVMVIPETDASLVSPGMPARVRLWGTAGLTRTGKVDYLGSRPLGRLPHEALSARFQGEVDTLPTERYNSRPSTPSVMATITMDAGQAPLPLDGSTGRAKVVVEERVTLARQQWRAMKQLIGADWWLWLREG